MAIKYVRKDGNDSTGDGSTGNPWLTIHKAAASVSAGDTVKIGTGTYAEDSGSGYLYLNQAFASETIFESETGSRDVIVVGASHATYNVLIQSTTGHMTFRHIKFESRDNCQSAVRIAGGASYSFLDCEWQANGESASSIYNPYRGLEINPTSGASVSGITIDTCEVSQVGTYETTGISINQGGAAGNIPSTITITDLVGANVGSCIRAGKGDTIAIGGASVESSSGRGIRMDGVSEQITNVSVSGCTSVSAIGAEFTWCDLDIDDNTFIGTGGYALKVGSDGTTGSPCAGSVTNNRLVSIYAATGHTLLIGAGCDTMTVTGNEVDATVAGYGVVAKHCHACTFSSNSVRGGAYGAFYLKASTDNIVTENLFIGSSGPSILLNEDSDDSTQCHRNVVSQNLVIATGAANLFHIYPAGLGDDNVIDSNQYWLRGTGDYGSVDVVADIASLEDLQAAWADTSTPTNDAASFDLGAAGDTETVGEALCVALATTATLPALLADIPTVAEMNARTLPSANYALEATLNAMKGAGWTDETLVAILTAAQAATAPSASDVADAVWDEALSGHTTTGTAGKALSTAGAAADPLLNDVPGSYAVGTGGHALGSIAAIKAKTDLLSTENADLQLVSAVVGSTITLRRGDTQQMNITGLGYIATRNKLYFGIKRYPGSQLDAQSILLAEETAGLSVLNGAAPSVGQTCTISVTDETDGDATITLSAAAQADMEPGNYYWQVKWIDAAGVVTTPAAGEGTLVVTTNVVRAIT